MRSVSRLCLLPVIGLALAACNQTSASAPQVAAASLPGGPLLPSGAGCTGEIGRYRAVMQNDLTTGHVNQSVYAKVDAEISRAEAACAAGRDAEATRMIVATKSRYGYR